MSFVFFIVSVIFYKDNFFLIISALFAEFETKWGWTAKMCLRIKFCNRQLHRTRCEICCTLTLTINGTKLVNSIWICTFCLFAGTSIRLPATVSTPLTQPGNFAIKENCPPFQELVSKVAKLSLSGSMCVSAYQLQFPPLSLSQETLQ
jgi:hypothetical protein